MSVLLNVYSSYQVLFNTFKQKIFKTPNENEKPVSIVDTHSVQYSQTTEPCRSCTDFRTFSRMKRQELNQPQSQSMSSKNTSPSDTSINPENQRADCPLDKDELGRSTWNLLHTIAATYSDEPSVEEQTNMQQFIKLIPKVYPCEMCANDFNEILTYHPPDTSSQEKFAHWMCEVHNIVNRKLEKPLFDCSKLNERWRDGWKDGHCD